MHFTKEHLVNKHYKWEAEAGNESPPASERRFFDRTNGHEMLHMINSFGSSLGKLTLRDGHNLEELIHKELPEDIKTSGAVFKWLKAMYLYRQNVLF
ncbi:MAG: hypothetical protein ACTHJ5_05730 [Ilyomonas sp.]